MHEPERSWDEEEEEEEGACSSLQPPFSGHLLSHCKSSIPMSPFACVPAKHTEISVTSLSGPSLGSDTTQQSRHEQMLRLMVSETGAAELPRGSPRLGEPGSPAGVSSRANKAVWKDAAAAPAQAPTAPTAGLRWGAGALAARLRPT
ncbi:unnamed protein product [Pleuronectes platessa]|uniref:Uncharacterized protein n=1 Tax=Pleuronectes platessa TaxID=8262 RepID=A0A9N7VQA7_PLEPL|nr:unnamed protein product [Pleuronectes platessa]